MTEDNLLYTLALQHVPNVGDVTAKKLIAHCGSAQEVLKEKPQHLLKIEGVGTKTVHDLSLFSLKDAEVELQFIRDNPIDYLYFMDDNYPERLKHCIDGPILLFQSGQINIKNQPIISVAVTAVSVPLLPNSYDASMHFQM